MDVSNLSEMGWTYIIELEQGLDNTYKWFLDNYKLQITKILGYFFNLVVNRNFIPIVLEIM